MINKEKKMHYRITKVHHAEGNREKLVEVLESKKKTLNSFDGLINVRLIGVSDRVTIAISEYESEEKLKNVETRFQDLMVDMMSLMSEPPEVHNGDVFWEHANR
tara:strand:- start:5 stop:316 length:312 start_codon:yes stop_codon:yes gene_type:complete